MKKWVALALCALLLYGLPGCANSGALTVERVRELAQKGVELTWSDFEAYESRDIGSGLHVYRYEIDDSYYLLIGGVLEEAPMYIHLVRAQEDGNGEYIDIRTEDVDDFLETQ